MAIDFGSPICTNMCRLEVKLSSPVQAGDLTALPRSLPLPPNQASTSVRNAALSLRSVNSRSLCSIADVHVEPQLVDVRVGRADVGRARHRLFEHVLAVVGQQPGHVPGHQAPVQPAGQPAEVRQPVGHERDQVRRTPGVGRAPARPAPGPSPPGRPWPGCAPGPPSGRSCAPAATGTSPRCRRSAAARRERRRCRTGCPTEWPPRARAAARRRAARPPRARPRPPPARRPAAARCAG